MLGLVRDVVIAANIGPHGQYDAYVLAMRIPDMLFILMTGGALSSAFIPIFTRLLQTDEKGAWRMASGAMFSLAVGVAAIAALCSIFAPQLIRYVLGFEASPQIQDLAIGLVRIVLIQPLFLSLAVVATSILQSFDRFTLPALAPIAYNSCIILGALAGPLLFAHGFEIYGVAIGVVVGAVLFFLTQLPATLRMGLRWPETGPLSDPNVRRTFRLLLPRVAGSAAVEANAWVAYILAAGLQTGAIAHFRLAYVVFLLPVGVFGTSVSTAAFPTMSREALETDPERFLYVLRRTIRSSLFLVIPAGLGILMLREPIVSLIYQRGETHASDVLMIAQPLLFFALGTWAYSMVDVLPRAFYALQDTVTPVRIALATVALDTILSILLVRPFGLGGLALAFSVAAFVQVGALVWALDRRVGPVFDRSVLEFLARAFVAAAAMLIFLAFAQHWVSGWATMRFAEKLLRVGTVVIAGAAIYLGLSAALHQEEVRVLRRFIPIQGPR